MKFEVVVLGSPSQPNSTQGFCGREAALEEVCTGLREMLEKLANLSLQECLQMYVTMATFCRNNTA